MCKDIVLILLEGELMYTVLTVCEECGIFRYAIGVKDLNRSHFIGHALCGLHWEGLCASRDPFAGLESLVWNPTESLITA